MTERLSLIAGSGALVPEVIAAAQGRGYLMQVLSLEQRRSIAGVPALPFNLARADEAVAHLRSFAPTMIAMAGGLQLSDRTREALLTFAGIGGSSIGDTAMSRVADYLTHATGARVVGVHEIAPETIAAGGHIAGPEASAVLLETAAFALELARQAGRLDLGQGVVVAGRRAIAAEDVAGTDALLKRVQAYRRFGLAADGSSQLVLAKAAKPDQPLAIDLPAIGPRTVVNARKAGVAMIVVQAGAAIVIQRSRLVAAADKAGIPVVALRVRDA